MKERMRPASTVKSNASRQRAGAARTTRSRSRFAPRRHLGPRGPVVPVPDLRHDRLVDDGEPGGAEECRPLDLAERAHVARIAPPLDVRHERGQLGIVVAQDVLDEEGAARPQDAGDLPEGGQQLGEMVGGDAARHGAEARLLERKGVHVGGQEADGASRPGRRRAGARPAASAR